MRIEELTPQQSITLLVIVKDQQLEFSSSVLECLPRRHMIIAAPILKDGKIISFNAKGILIHLIVTFPDQKPIVFQNVTINTAKNNDNSFCYTITTLAESREFNRRGAFRCFIGINTHIRVGNNSSALDATIKDISTTGFSFMVSPKIEINEKETVHAVVNDHIEETAKNYSFHLFGLIIRHYKLENGNIVYGCKLTNKVVGLDSYIMEKERIRLQKSRGNSKTPVKKDKQ